MRRRFAVALACAAVFATLGLAPSSVFAVPLHADLSSKLGTDCSYHKQLESEIPSARDARAMTEEVWDTYLSLTGVLNGQPVKGKIIKVYYKRLTFNRSYTQLPSTLVSVESILDNNHYMEGIGMVYGSIETWKCNYSVN